MDEQQRFFIGFFNSREQGWRPPNFMGFRLSGNNEPVQNVGGLELSYGTAGWAAGGVVWGETIFPDGASFNRFGIFNMQDNNGKEALVYFDDLDYTVEHGNAIHDWDHNAAFE